MHGQKNKKIKNLPYDFCSTFRCTSFWFTVGRPVKSQLFRYMPQGPALNTILFTQCIFGMFCVALTINSLPPFPYTAFTRWSY